METCTFSNLFNRTLATRANNTAVIENVDNQTKLFKYTELASVSERIFKRVFGYFHDGFTVGLFSTPTPLTLPLLNVIHSCKCNFIFMNAEDFEENERIVEKFKISFVFSYSSDKIFPGFKATDLSDASHPPCGNLYLWKRNVQLRNSVITDCDTSYIIRTSGSTGKPKYVAVSHASLYHNVRDLDSTFDVKGNDVIYFSTPLTFDPSLVEVYLAVKRGAALMIAKPDLDKLFGSVEKFRITIWQTTPSKFLLFGKDSIRKVILREDSPLKILALGGEPIGCDLNLLKHRRNSTLIFNLYGITEVSCWASVNRIDDKEMKDYFCLGRTLSETSIEIINKDGIEKIHIGSQTRKCLVDDEIFESDLQGEPADEIVWRDTGDVGEKINHRIYFKCRADRLVKRFGCRVDLSDIESIAGNFRCVERCVCHWDGEKHFLVLFYTGDVGSENDLRAHLREEMDGSLRPDDVIRLDVIPVNSHGKISLKEIEEIYNGSDRAKELGGTVGDLFIDLTERFSPSRVTERNKSFVHSGGTSFSAVQILNRMGMLTGESFFHIYTELMNPLVLLDDIYGMLSAPNVKDKDTEDSRKNTESRAKRPIAGETDAKRLKSHHGVQFKISWKYNMKKCIDSNPVAYSKPGDGDCVIIVGSHSGEIAALDSQSGSVIMSMNTNSRIEVSVLCFDDVENVPPSFAFGCYDGSFWCVSLFESKALWKARLGAMIKSKACKIEGNLYVATYGGIVHEINAKSGRVSSSVDLNDLGIGADLLAFNGAVFAATLGGTCARVVSDGRGPSVGWRKKLDGPVFAGPVAAKDGRGIIFSAVRGKIHCLDAESGREIWIFADIGGPLFTPCMVDGERVVFGCHDRHAYAITSGEDGEPTLVWKVEHSSEIYSSPCRLSASRVALVSTDGRLRVADADCGATTGEFEFPGEVFSSPVCARGRVYVGCRDNNLYCLETETEG